jgi:hypothetical protein
LEVCLGPIDNHERISHSVAENFTIIMNFPPEARKTVMQQTKRYYNLRSSAVHNGNTNGLTIASIQTLTVNVVSLISTLIPLREQFSTRKAMMNALDETRLSSTFPTPLPAPESEA